MYKCLFFFTIVVSVILTSEALFVRHKKENPETNVPHLVYGPPKPSPPKDTEPLLTKEDYIALLSAVKEKISENNPLVWIKNKISDKLHKKPVPEYQLRPELGFTHYNKFQYVPLVPVFVDPTPVAPIDEKTTQP